MESSTGMESVIWIGTVVMLLLVFGLLFMAVFYQRHVAQMRQKEAEKLLKTALESEKKERQRIATDLHDSVQSDISAIRNYFTILSRKVTDEPVLELIEVIKTVIDQTADNTRSISYKLMPPLLQTSGFCAAVQNHFERLTESTGKNFSMQADLPSTIIPAEKAYELFRIVQELTQNMLKYGNISECKLFIYETEKSICLEVVDDGILFDFKSSFQESTGSGLYNIKSRLASIEAEMLQREVIEGNHFVITLNK